AGHPVQVASDRVRPIKALAQAHETVIGVQLQPQQVGIPGRLERLDADDLHSAGQGYTVCACAEWSWRRSPGRPKPARKFWPGVATRSTQRSPLLLCRWSPIRKCAAWAVSAAPPSTRRPAASTWRFTHA